MVLKNVRLIILPRTYFSVQSVRRVFFRSVPPHPGRFIDVN